MESDEQRRKRQSDIERIHEIRNAVHRARDPNFRPPNLSLLSFSDNTDDIKILDTAVETATKNITIAKSEALLAHFLLGARLQEIFYENSYENSCLKPKSSAKKV